MNAFVGQSFQMNQIINLIDVIEFKSINRAKIMKWSIQKSKYYDSTFPKPVRLSESLYWLVSLGNKSMDWR